MIIKPEYRVKEENGFTLFQAALWILFSVIVITGSLSLGWYYYVHFVSQRNRSENFLITGLLLQPIGSEKLPSSYIAELLELSVDKPINIYRFQTKEALEKLQNSFHIKYAEIDRVKPGYLWIAYEVREPAALLANYENRAIDQFGEVFPYLPFYKGRNLPKVYLDLPKGEYSYVTSMEFKQAAQQNLKLLEEIKVLEIDGWKISRVDFSKQNALSFGQRQIIVQLTKSATNQEHFLRFSPDQVAESLHNYQKLQKSLQSEKLYTENSLIIDLRIPQLAYISIKKEAS